MAGKTFLAFEQYYGGIAIAMEDTYGSSQSEDITLNNITINSGPGMGIRAYGLQRGLGIWNSHIMPAAGSLISTEYDALHILNVGGDVYIHDNVIANQGDDALNLNSMVMPVVSYSGTSLELGPDSTDASFIQQYDLLSFFDASNNFLGTAQVTAVPVNMGNNDYGFTLNNAVPGVTTTSLVRDMSLVDSRVAYVNNTIQNCWCRGIVEQVPNVLIQGNTFTDLMHGGIVLHTELTSNAEGIGVINVQVQNNTINTTGADVTIPNNSLYGAIQVYADTPIGIISTVSNKYINIANNTISSADRECIAVSSSDYVDITSNSCNSTNLTNLALPASISPIRIR